MATRLAPGRTFTPFDPGDLTSRLVLSGGGHPSWISSLPSLLTHAYRLSLSREEGRPLRFALVLGPAGRPLAREKRLATALEATHANLRALSAIAGPFRDCLHVECGEDRSPRVVGVAERPHLEDVEDAEELLVLEVRDAACLVLEWNRGEVRFVRDSVEVPDGRARLRELVALASCEALVHALSRDSPRSPALLRDPGIVPEDRWRLHREHFGSEVASEARGSIARGMAFILEAVRSDAHGGTVVVLGSDGSHPSVHRVERHALEAHAFDTSLGTDNQPWNLGMLEHLFWSATAQLARGGSHLMPGEPRSAWPGAAASGAETPGRSALALQRWRDDARRCADLARVDGAVVLDRLLDPVLFGLKIALDGHPFLPEPWREHLQRKGTRHRATACLADALPGSTAFAVSQDGDITAFRSGLDAPVSIRL